MNLKGWLHKRAADMGIGTREVILHGFRVMVNNTRPEIDTNDVLERLVNALRMVEEFVPHHFRHMQRDFYGFLVQRYACRGAYFPDKRICLVELTFTVNRDFSLAQVAATILHEAMHARLHQLGFPLEMEDRARQERFCRRAEIEFGSAVPGGRPVVDRALAALASADQDVAPHIDPILAARRVARADLEALNAPGWLRRTIAERRRSSETD